MGALENDVIPTKIVILFHDFHAKISYTYILSTFKVFKIEFFQMVNIQNLPHYRSSTLKITINYLF